MVSTLTPSASTMVATDDLLDAAAASAGVTIDESRREAQLDSLKDVDTMCQKVLSMPGGFGSFNAGLKVHPGR